MKIDDGGVLGLKRIVATPTSARDQFRNGKAIDRIASRLWQCLFAILLGLSLSTIGTAYTSAAGNQQYVFIISMLPLHGHRGPLCGIGFWSYPKRINGSLDTEAVY